MNRRAFLAATGASVSAVVAGCLDGGLDDDTSSNDAVTPTAGTHSELDKGCGPADRPLSELLTDDTGVSSRCPEGASPSFAIENERDESVTVAIELRGGDAFSESFTLDPDERVVEHRAFDGETELTGTVVVDGDETTVEWPARSCHRHGIALTDDGVAVGWMTPFQGPGDTQHDCYAGDDALLTVRSRRSQLEDPGTLTVTVTDRCRGRETTESFQLEPEDFERVDHLLRNGGMYDVSASFEGGEPATVTFHEDCWGMDVTVDEDEEIQFGKKLID